MQGIIRATEQAANVVLFFIKILVSVLLIGSVLLIVISATGRYFFDAPVRAQAEYLRYALTALVFFGAVLVTWDDRHLKMDLVSASLGPVGRTIVNAIAIAGFMFAVGYACWYSIGAADEVGDADSLIAEIPMIVPHAILPIGLGLMVIALLLRMGRHVRGSAAAAELETLPSVAGAAGSSDAGNPDARNPNSGERT